jgi:mRNA interferase RelE/StbE
MNVDLTKSFERDISKIRDKKVSDQLFKLLEDLSSCKDLTQIAHLKKLKAGKNHYRIRVGDYRLGFKLESNIIILMRFLDRKDMYKYFP